MLKITGRIFCGPNGMPNPPANLKARKYINSLSLKRLIYFENLLNNKLCTMSLKKQFAIEYKINAPNEIEKTEINVPNHFPKSIPEIMRIGVPNPKSETQIIQNIKKIKRLI